MLDGISTKSLSSQLRLEEMDSRTDIQVNINNGNTTKNVGIQKKISKKQIEEIVNSMNEFVQPTHTSLKFELHEKLGEYYVTIRDDITDEVIREIPPKKLLDTYAAMAEFLGFLVDRKI